MDMIAWDNIFVKDYVKRDASKARGFQGKPRLRLRWLPPLLHDRKNYHIFSHRLRLSGLSRRTVFSVWVLSGKSPDST